MVDRMREKPGGNTVEVTIGDMSRVTTGDRRYAYAWIAAGTAAATSRSRTSPRRIRATGQVRRGRGRHSVSRVRSGADHIDADLRPAASRPTQPCDARRVGGRGSYGLRWELLLLHGTGKRSI